jgi:hypothetical protein
MSCTEKVQELDDLRASNMKDVEVVLYGGGPETLCLFPFHFPFHFPFSFRFTSSSPSLMHLHRFFIVTQLVRAVECLVLCLMVTPQPD